MRVKRLTARAIIIPIALAEVVHSREAAAATVPSVPALSAAGASFVYPPHIHSDFQTERRGSNYAPFFDSSRHRQQDLFQLIIARQPDGFRLTGVPDLEWHPDSQLMFGFCATLDELLDRLTPKVTDAQLAALRMRFSGGSSQEIIGGSPGTRFRVFERRELERLGMTFRPPEDL